MGRRKAAPAERGAKVKAPQALRFIGVVEGHWNHTQDEFHLAAADPNLRKVAELILVPQPSPA
ncbi:hypothetical protein MOX02_52670 [Methylobacterium oxalidis]|uniref:Uncharacterized protein n=1 Tax=Methylobacterium oxalidis TaxID=944322 RepID=A0A512JBG7_9HYPH|nr:hypothetical protein MOX02_52670 [Methylobacterium oxalidis]GLS63459.1 hypothetical protein GCM10007888_18400 [Methylobacterium oxalidis]